MKEFLVEVRARADAGYSTRQLMSSLIPAIGTELKVADREVAAALQDYQVAFRGQPRGIIIFYVLHVLFIFSRLHQHRVELVFYRGPAVELFYY